MRAMTNARASARLATGVAAVVMMCAAGAATWDTNKDGLRPIPPLFSQGKFAAGIDAGVDRIMAVVDDGKPLPPPGKTARRPTRSGNIDFGTLFIVLLVAVPLVGGVLRSVLGNLGGSLVGGGIA